jgi:predicted alpha/beta superfamily hydrolase
MAGIVSQQITNGGILISIFVGIGYLGGDDTETNRDYTPSVTQNVEYGITSGVENFYNFIRTELVPELEDNYQDDSTNTKTLMGHSYGGLFTLFTIF